MLAGWTRRREGGGRTAAGSRNLPPPPVVSGGMKPITPTLILTLAIMAVTVSAARAADSAAILARAKEATGGKAWDSVRVLHTRVRAATGGLSGPAESWDDLRTGHYVDTYALGPVQGAEGFDGKAWSQDNSGQTRVDDSGEGREGSANESYRRSLAYWYPERHKAEITDAGDHAEGGRSFHVLRIVPEGGRPFEMWIDARTSLIDRTVEKTTHDTRTIFLSDYREANGLRFPFASRSTNGEARYDITSEVQAIEVNPPLDEARFRRPEGKTHDFALAGGKTAEMVPFRLLNNHIYVQARMNGRPLQVLFDTGGANILTPSAVERLGLKSKGSLQVHGSGEGSESAAVAKVDEVALGDVTLRGQFFLVLPLAGLAQVEGVDVDGIVGFEVLKRLITRVEYAKGELTFFLPDAFREPAGAAVVPFTFEGETPQVEGAIDGIKGLFTIDTGSRTSLTLNSPFTAEHALKERYAPKVEAVSGWGVGGGVRSLMTRAKLLELGGVQVPEPVTDLALVRKGALANRYLAGNVGGGVLRRFDITFDYGRQRLYFQPNANYSRPDAYDRAGLWLNRADAGFEVMDVVAGGPAAEAGLKAGNTIVAVDGQAAKELILPDVRTRLKESPPGTRVRLMVRSGEGAREVTVVLRDLV